MTFANPAPRAHRPRNGRNLHALPARARSGMRLAMLCGWLCLLLAGHAAAQPAAFEGLRLQDHRLQPVGASALKGRPVLLHFVFAGCTTVCPGQLLALQQLHAALPAAARAQVQFVAVTVDPLSDTPQALARFAQARGLDLPGWRFVSGPPAQVHTLLDRMQVFAPATGPAPVATAAAARKAAPDPNDHRTALYLFAADGQLVQRFRGQPIDQPRLRDEITALTAHRP